jgi:hypothetical protein
MAKFGIVALIMGVFIASVSASVTSNTFDAYGLDTVAGVNTYLRTSQTAPNASVVFDVKKPDGDIVSVSAVTNTNGVAQAEFTDYHTRISGQYAVVGHFEGSSSVGGVNVFDVLPGDVSVASSTVFPADQVIRSTSERASLMVSLKDDYGNPISDHVVTVVSSSSHDSVSPISAMTDDSGQAEFYVSSDVSGTTTYTVYDSTSDVVLDSRAKVLYVIDGTQVLDNYSVNPEQYFYAASGNGGLSIDSFEFAEITPSITVGSSVSFKLSSWDASSQVVEDYNGTVRFSVDGGNSFYANLPDDYAFVESDLGEHTFSLSTSFLQEGSYSVKAQDLNDPTILGEQAFIVTAGGAAPSSSSILVSNPVSGTYSNPIQVISGTADAGVELKIFDNDLEIANLTAELDGSFSFTTGILADGAHSIYVASVNDIGTIIDTSDIIAFTVDTASPDVGQITLSPDSNVSPGTVVTASISTGENLSQAAVIVNGSIYEMQANPDGGYSTSFPVPIEFGDYNIDLVTVDALGNESRVDSATLLSVGVFNNEDALVPDVVNLVALSDDHRVTLTWSAPEASVNTVKNYRVYFGLNPAQLTEAVDTMTSANTWYIPNLKNGVEYFFAVVAVDELGNVSEHFSNIVSSTPNPLVVDVVDPDVEQGTAGSDALEEMESDVSETGPEVLWLLLAALAGGYFYNRSLARRAEVKGICDSYENIIGETRDINKKIRDSLFK